MSKSDKQLSGEELGKKLLQSVKEMKAGKVARVTQITKNENEQDPDIRRHSPGIDKD